MSEAPILFVLLVLAMSAVPVIVISVLLFFLAILTAEIGTRRQ